MFNLDLNLLRVLIIPVKLRKTIFLSFLRVLYKPLNTIQNLFLLFFNKIKYDLTFNGQVFYLEHLLNDYFDPSQRRIYIDELEMLPEITIYKQIEEDDELYLSKFNEVSQELVYLFTDTEYENDNDFTVVLPIGFSYDENVMKALINKYKIAGVRYNIIEL